MVMNALKNEKIGPVDYIRKYLLRHSMILREIFKEQEITIGKSMLLVV